jgi:hypothetical protein
MSAYRLPPMRLLRALAWVAAGALVVLGARTLAYGISPSALAAAFQHRAGGPFVPFAAVGALGVCIVVAAAVVWLAALGVRERALVEDAPAPRLGLRQLAVRAVLLFVATSLAFALFESYLHWRAGLGWHGLRCLTGPVHRDAIPILGGLSLVAAALAAALEHVLAWMRRTMARLSEAPWSLVLSTFAGPTRALAHGRVSGRARARAPPPLLIATAL